MSVITGKFGGDGARISAFSRNYLGGLTVQVVHVARNALDPGPMKDPGPRVIGFS